MNSEIVARLDQSFSDPPELPVAEADDTYSDNIRSDNIRSDNSHSDNSHSDRDLLAEPPAGAEQETISSAERRLLHAFRRLSEEKRSALLDLLI